MTEKSKPTRNEYTRDTITSIISESEPNAILKTSDITLVLAKRYRGVNHRNVGNLLRERDDVELVKAGTWRVL